jgi:hypothetical protein
MMLGNVSPGRDNPPPPEAEPAPDDGHPTPLICKILYVWAVLNCIGGAIALGEGEGWFAIGAFLGALLLVAIGLYLHNQSDNSAEMVRLMRERSGKG